MPLYRAGGHILGTPTNDAASSGEIGEEIVSRGSGGSATITVTIATPAVVTWAAHGFTGYHAINFTTTIALPTGLVAGTTYFVVPIDANTFNLATTLANAITGAYIATSGTQSGVHTGIAAAILSTGATKDIAAISLTAGDWDVASVLGLLRAASTSVTFEAGSISTATNTFDATAGRYNQETFASVVAAGTVNRPLTPVRFSLAVTTTIFLNALCNFTVAAESGFGVIRARRMR